jgi:hypothetical protein
LSVVNLTTVSVKTKKKKEKKKTSGMLSLSKTTERKAAMWLVNL